MKIQKINEKDDRYDKTFLETYYHDAYGVGDYFSMLPHITPQWGKHSFGDKLRGCIWFNKGMEDKIRTTCNPNEKHGGNHSGAGDVVFHFLFYSE